MWPPPVLAKNVAGESKAYFTLTPPPDKSVTVTVVKVTPPGEFTALVS